jgi:hypothetical protein
MMNCDGRRIATFYRGRLLVRGLDDPDGGRNLQAKKEMQVINLPSLCA